MPTPVNDPPGSPLDTEAAGRLHDWRELYSQDITSGIVSLFYPDWLERSDRVLLNEQDTAFHMARASARASTGSRASEASASTRCASRTPTLTVS